MSGVEKDKSSFYELVREYMQLVKPPSTRISNAKLAPAAALLNSHGDKNEKSWRSGMSRLLSADQSSGEEEFEESDNISVLNDCADSSVYDILAEIAEINLHHKAIYSKDGGHNSTLNNQVVSLNNEESEELKWIMSNSISVAHQYIYYKLYLNKAKQGLKQLQIVLQCHAKHSSDNCIELYMSSVNDGEKPNRLNYRFNLSTDRHKVLTIGSSNELLDNGWHWIAITANHSNMNYTINIQIICHKHNNHHKQLAEDGSDSAAYVSCTQLNVKNALLNKLKELKTNPTAFKLFEQRVERILKAKIDKMKHNEANLNTNYVQHNKSLHCRKSLERRRVSENSKSSQLSSSRFNKSIVHLALHNSAIKHLHNEAKSNPTQLRNPLNKSIQIGPEAFLVRRLEQQNHNSVIIQQQAVKHKPIAHSYSHLINNASRSPRAQLLPKLDSNSNYLRTKNNNHNDAEQRAVPLSARSSIIGRKFASATEGKLAELLEQLDKEGDRGKEKKEYQAKSPEPLFSSLDNNMDGELLTALRHHHLSPLLLSTSSSSSKDFSAAFKPLESFIPLLNAQHNTLTTININPPH
jgi:hypothetical protein